MNKVLITLVFSLFITSVSGQFKVKIGNDTTYCYQNFKNGIHLAPHLKFENGQPPYTYTWTTYWEAEVPFIRKNIFTASDFVNDTTLSNPIFNERANNIFGPSNWIQFILKVTDNNKNVAIDSINIRVSIIADVPSMEYQYEIYINQGDSVWLDGASDYMGIKPYQKYIWEPTTGLSHPDSVQTWCKPIKEGGYEFSVFDSVGCQSAFTPLYQIRFKSTNIDIINDENDNIIQVGNAIHFNNQKAESTQITFLDLSGRIIHKTETKNHFYEPDFEFPAPGVYICKIQAPAYQSSIKYIYKGRR